jgi:hypothetical protein
VEAYNSVGKVERYYAPLRRAYDIIKSEVDDNVLALQIVVKAINDSAGPNGIVPTLLVFGTYPRMSIEDNPMPGIMRRAETIRTVIREVRRLYAERSVTEVLAARNGPDTAATLALPINSKVRVWREKKG